MDFEGGFYHCCHGLVQVLFHANMIIGFLEMEIYKETQCVAI